jgi:hypothetical protein
MIPVFARPFVAGGVVLPDRQGQEQLIVLLKATYDVSPEGRLVVAEEQDLVVPADELRGEPDTSSIEFEAEMMPPKPLGTDVFLVGCAVAPRPGTRQMTIGFRVATVTQSALVSGYRVWREGALGAAAYTEPLPFEKVPLVYELAFGGEDKSASDPSQWEGEPRNRVGRGFRAKASKASPIRTPTDRPSPVGFGPIGRHWMPRMQYAGTYDERWQQQRMPLLPEDFDDRFHHAAPPERIVPGCVRGGEPVDIIGCTARGRLCFLLPSLHPTARVATYLRSAELDLRCETVTVDTDRMKLVMLFKAAIRLGRDLVMTEEIAIDPGGSPS